MNLLVKMYEEYKDFGLYKKGFEDATIKFSYIDPYWTKEQVNEYVRGYKDGKNNKWNFDNKK
jgi:hypothetical protein